jgi:steroid delta-isomerase-like uncharacterized protein
MSSEITDLEKQTRDIIAAFNSHNVDRFLSFHTDDVIVNMADGTVAHGKEEAGANLKRIFAAFPDYSVELTSFFASGNHACVEGIASGTHTGNYMGIPATGKRFSLRVVSISELREGKASRVSAYSDSASLMRQLGVLPPTPQK